MGMNLFARITKIDEARREVWGRAAEEVVDKVDEILDYAKSKPYFEAWSKSFADATDGKSLGNLRAMHGKVAAGKLIAFNPHDAEKAFDIGARIVDDAEWTKALEGVYTGFSIGGSYVGEKIAEKIDGRDVRRYVANPSEISLVDNPCIPTAKFFDIIKADGSVLQKAFQNTAPADPAHGGGAAAEGGAPAAVTPPVIEVTGTDDEVAAFAKVLNDSGLTMADAIKAIESAAKAAQDAQLKKDDELISGALAKPLIASATPEAFSSNVAAEIKAGTKKERAVAIAYAVQRKAKAKGKGKGKGKKTVADELEKGMWNVQSFASCLSSLADVARSAQYDLEAEGDASPVPEQIRAWVGAGIEIFKAMATEEADELLEELQEHAGDNGETAGVLAAAFTIGALRKRLADPALPITELAVIAAKHDEPLTTAILGDMPALVARIVAKAARSANTDAAHLQEAHDHLTAMGATCAAGKAAPVGDLAKGAELAQQLADALARIKKLEAQPMPSVVTLRMAKLVSKEQDSAPATEGAAPFQIDPNTVELTKDDPVVTNADGSIDYHSTRLMKARKLQREQMAPAR